MNRLPLGSLSTLNGAVMASIFLCILPATLLAAGAHAQESTPSEGTPSVADAARAARKGQKTASQKHVITDDDIAPKIGAADAAGRGASEQEVRAELEKKYSALLTKSDMMGQITHMQAVVASGEAGMLTSFKRSTLAGYEGVEFPGKKEWEQSLSVAVSRMVEEAGKGLPRLQAIVDQNQNVLAGHDPAASAQLREMWMAAVLPYATWQQRARNLGEDGRERAKAYATGSPTGGAQYQHEAVNRNEIAVGGMLSSMHIVEDQLRRVQGHYACDETQWPRDPQDPEIPNAMWTIYMKTASSAGYRLDIQGCDAHHYSAVAAPKASDGSGGRAFCMNESGAVRVAPDGNTATCMSRGSEWNGR